MTYDNTTSARNQNDFQALRSDVAVHSDGRGTVVTARLRRRNVFGVVA